MHAYNSIVQVDLCPLRTATALVVSSASGQRTLRGSIPREETWRFIFES
jgi:hypothetical protein